MNSARIGRRTIIAGALATGAALPAMAQQGPIKIGMSMPLTGGLAAGGKSALIGIEVWRDDINEKGGLLGRKVELIVYDDKSSAAETPAIYSKLLDVDKVDLLFAPYATVPTAPIMPLVKQRDLLLMGNFSFQVNRTVKHDKWFNNAPWGPADSWARGFIDLGMKSGAKTMALIGADQEFAQNLMKIAKDVANEKGVKVVYEQSYPPATVEFSAMVRAIRAARADMVFVCSYPPDSVGLLRAINEIGIGDSVKLFGGGMVGLQFAAVMESMGSLLNGVVNYNSWLPEKSMEFAGTKEFFAKYQKRAVEAKVDPLGYYLAPFGYAMGQMVEQAANSAKSLDQKKMADFLRSNEMATIVGPIAFGPDGERKESATLMAQFRGVVDKNVEQFRNPGKQIILFPEKWKTGELVAPFDKARK
ncbi:MAG: branched-chain amino acid ABC transporter substrate-binding protein [Reyranella sp.]|nr:MAG: branched-chain amino acid ABC transporter substrate-binding protein [Reyranella sp.]